MQFRIKIHTLRVYIILCKQAFRLEFVYLVAIGNDAVPSMGEDSDIRAARALSLTTACIFS